MEENIEPNGGRVHILFGPRRSPQHSKNIWEPKDSFLRMILVRIHLSLVYGWTRCGSTHIGKKYLLTRKIVICFLLRQLQRILFVLIDR